MTSKLIVLKKNVRQVVMILKHLEFGIRMGEEFIETEFKKFNTGDLHVVNEVFWTTKVILLKIILYSNCFKHFQKN